MVSTGGKILNFGLCESLKFELSRTFYSPKLSLESWMLHCTQAVIRRWPSNLFLQISQILQENICVGVSFNKNEGPNPPTLIKRDSSNTAVFQ